MNYSFFPPLNASLNAASAFLLLLGYGFIRRKRVNAHRFCMLSALATSVIFLGCYLFYHFHAGVTRFAGQGLARQAYFFILTTHTLLAACVPVLAGITVTRAFKGNFEKHRKIARVTFPIWLYVSVTGVVVYLMLYQFYPSR